MFVLVCFYNLRKMFVVLYFSVKVAYLAFARVKDSGNEYKPSGIETWPYFKTTPVSSKVLCQNIATFAHQLIDFFGKPRTGAICVRFEPIIEP